MGFLTHKNLILERNFSTPYSFGDIGSKVAEVVLGDVGRGCADNFDQCADALNLL